MATEDELDQLIRTGQAIDLTKPLPGEDDDSSQLERSMRSHPSNQHPEPVNKWDVFRQLYSN